MENLEYKLLLTEIIFEIKDKAYYLTTIDSNDSTFNQKYFEGMAMAYHQVLDSIKRNIEAEDDIDLSEFGLDDFRPEDILSYKPLD